MAGTGLQSRTFGSMAEFLEECRRAIRYRLLSYHTEKSYLDWMEKFVRHFKRVKPQDMDSWHAREYLTYLATERQVSAPTQNVAFSAILFLFRHVLDKELDVEGAQGVVRARESRHLPVVLAREECRALLAQLSGPQHPVASLLYGAGLRLSEGIRLRVKDLDFARGTLTIREGKGDKDRITVPPQNLVAPQSAHLEVQRHLWQEQEVLQRLHKYLELRRGGPLFLVLPAFFSSRRFEERFKIALLDAASAGNAARRCTLWTETGACGSAHRKGISGASVSEEKSSPSLPWTRAVRMSLGAEVLDVLVRAQCASIM